MYLNKNNTMEHGVGDEVECTLDHDICIAVLLL